MAKEQGLGTVTLPAEKRLAELGLQAAMDSGDAKALKAAIVSAKPAAQFFLRPSHSE